MKKLKKKIQLAVKVYKSGNLIKAEHISKKLIIDNPKVAFLYNLIGLILFEQKKIDDAIEYFEKGLKIDPKFAIIYNNLGLIYINNGTYTDNDKAENLYKKCIEINKNLVEPYNNLGNLYKSQNKYDESIKYYLKAIDISPKSYAAYHNLGTTHVTMGNFAEAKNLFKESIRLNPVFFASHRSLSRIIKYKANEGHFDELKVISKNINKYDDNNKIEIFYSLGKAYEDIKDFKNSFKYYNDANLLMRKKINYSIKDEIKRFDEIKNTYDKELFEKLNKLGSKDQSCIFIVGMPRSGSTLIEQIFSSHPRVFGGDESQNIPDLIDKNVSNRSLSLFFDYIAQFDQSLLKNIGDEYVLRMKKMSSNSDKITDKLPINFLNVGFIKLVLPKSKIIHCYRNPKDNVLSIYKNFFPDNQIKFSHDINETIEFYKNYKNLMDYWNSVLPNFIYNIKYEDLINNTKNQIVDLLKFCDLNWDDKCLNFHKNKRPIKTASDTQARNKVYASSINYWKNYESYLGKYLEKLD